MNKILVTGRNGQLGSELTELTQKLGRFEEFIFLDREEMDLSSKDSIQSAWNRFGPFKAVISGGAWTAVDLAEKEVDACRAINAKAPTILAELCAKEQIPMIQISTDFVFDGTHSTPIPETAPANPISIYGLTKYEGEVAIQKTGANCMIIRTSWLYSQYGNNFVKTMRRLGSERDVLSIVSDQIGTPTWAADLAIVILKALDMPELPIGVYHFSNQGTASWYDFAHAVIELSQIECKVRPNPTSAYPTPAKRPHYSVMDKAKIEQTLNIEIPHWRDSLQKCIIQLNQQA